MKRLAVAALALVLLPAAALAQSAPPPEGPPPAAPEAMGAPNPARFEAMRKMREQMTALHAQARVSMLASLTPAHRAQIASLIGAYAVSATPNPDVLARQLDTLLSKNELQSVVNIASGERSTMRGMMEAARTQMESTMTADQKAAMTARESQRATMHGQHQMRTPDPGRELLHALIGGGREFGHGGPGMAGRPM